MWVTYKTPCHPCSFRLFLGSETGLGSMVLWPSLAPLPSLCPLGIGNESALLCEMAGPLKGHHCYFCKPALPLAMQGTGQENLTFSSIS